MQLTTRTALAGLAIAQGVAAALPPIEIKGSKFFYENGTQFYMKGIAYQQDTAAAGGETTTGKFIDPLVDEAICKRDVPLLQKLRTNTIRVYAIDPEEDHSACMKILDAAGIYVVADLGEPATSINRKDPKWNTVLFDRYKAVVDELAQYDNTIGFFAGNEVSNDNKTTGASAYVKAAVRDTKTYIKSKNYRSMGVGYAANDDKDIRSEIAHYFNCGDEDNAIDFWGYNIYSWCQDSTMEKSSYNEQIKFFANYSVPVFFAEYGCNVPDGAEGRIWEETTALYEDEMTEVFSGGIVYMFHQEANDYGLVKIGKDDKATTMKNFAALQTVIAKVDPSSTSADAYKPTNTPQTCPGITDMWKVTGDSLPPTPDSSLCDCMYASVSCVPSKSLDEEDYGDLFGYICGLEGNLCAGINGDPETGVYGAYGMCAPKQQLGYVLDVYYKSVGEATACDFDGQATTQSPTTADKCEAALSSAASVNAIAATATAGSSGTSSGSGSGDDDSFGVASAQVARLFSVGDLAVGAYLGVAVMAGVGMIAL
jgi:hypothetical protein